jgi:hypothetical protein
MTNTAKRSPAIQKLSETTSICDVVFNDNTAKKLDGMCLYVLEDQSDLEDHSIKISDLKFRALEKYLERKKSDPGIDSVFFKDNYCFAIFIQ